VVDGPIQECTYFRKGAAPGWIGVEAAASDLCKWSRDGSREDRFGIAGRVPDRQLLRECFDQCDAERPDVGVRGDRLSCDLRSGMNVVGEEGGSWFPNREQAVRREANVVFDHEDIGGLEVPMYEASFVKRLESVEDGIEHLARFIDSKRALRDDLGEEFLSEIRDDVNAVVPVHLGMAVVVDHGQVRAGKLCSSRPTSQVVSGSGRGRNQLEGCFLGTGAVKFGEEGAAGAGPAEPLEKRIFPVDDLADPVAANRNSIHG